MSPTSAQSNTGMPSATKRSVDATELLTAPGSDKDELLVLVASLERYSKHPLSSAILEAAEEKKFALKRVSAI